MKGKEWKKQKSGPHGFTSGETLNGVRPQHKHGRKLIRESTITFPQRNVIALSRIRILKESICSAQMATFGSSMKYQQSVCDF